VTGVASASLDLREIAISRFQSRISQECGWDWQPLSLPCKFRKPFLYEGDSLVIQDESRKHVKEPRFSEQHLCCLGQITPKIWRRFCDLPKQSISSLDYSHEIFKIVTGLKIRLAASPKCFHLRSQEKRRGNHSDRLSSGQSDSERMTERGFIPDV